MFVAFTATTTAKTLASFGAPFDTYTEEEAIQEGYILDVAQNIVSYQTLYNLKIKDAFPDKEYPAGIVHRMLQNLAYADEGIIQYKSELIIKMFEERVADKIGGKAKAMVVASTRPAGLKYFNNLKTIIREKGLSYKVLFAFSDYSDPDTNQRVEEEKINELDTLHGGAVIEDVFDNDEYRILVVANKFQTGFDQPLLTAMFLDKVVNGVNAIQTVSRLNRKHPDKEQDDILVVDFTNNSANIFNAFNLHRTGTPYKAEEPAKEILQRVYDQIHAMDVFSDEEFREYSVAYIEAELEARKRNSAPDAALSGINQQYRSKFRERFPNTDDQKKYLSLLKRFAKLYYFIAQFFVLDDELNDFIVPAEALGSMLLKQGKSSELTQLLKNIDLSRGAVQYVGEIENKKRRASATGIGLNLGGDGPDPPRTSIGEAVAKIRDKYSISDADAIVISEICEEISSDHEIRTPIIANSQNVIYLNQNAKPRVRSEVKNKYMGREMWEKLDDPIYIDQGGIVTLMGEAIVNIVLSSSANA